MMTKYVYQILLFTLLTLTALSVAHPVLAHGDEPRLEIGAGSMNPGGVIAVRGVDFEFEQAVALALIGPGVEIPVGEITTDAEGVFLQIVTLPVDLKEGAYQFRAVTGDHEILSPALLVQGPAILEEGGSQDQREEDDGLLAPMPTFAPGVVPGGAAQPTVQPSTTTTASVPSRNLVPVALIVLLVAGVLAVFGSSVVRKR